jgi:hypothetical protein
MIYVAYPFSFETSQTDNLYNPDMETFSQQLMTWMHGIAAYTILLVSQQKGDSSGCCNDCNGNRVSLPFKFISNRDLSNMSRVSSDIVFY